MTELLKGLAWEEVFATLPSVSVAVIGIDGSVRYCNEASCELFEVDMPPDKLIGKRLNDVFRPEFVTERLAWIDRAIKSGRPVRGHQIHHAKHLVSCIYPIETSDPRCALVVTYRDGDDDLMTVVHSEFIDLGELSPLSPRELEIFILLGHGKSVPAIAKMLHRSPRTIERHKGEIGRKIGLSSIAEIARVVGQVGLEYDDLKLKRYQALRSS
ncbi:Bacterial regulatory protein, luxR family [Stieleria bergensis]|uniref:Bacterial regulatory protein, luxR family n=1 Tax=Stieleria bergensis TaxID=2528025 RepID=A0A517SZH7_9BACT|nr:Bacterial regulatory protein, luxR family [Planctomycetes bacterium SV_7m_r]